MYNDKNNNGKKFFKKRDDRPKNVTMTVGLFELAKTTKVEYDRDTLLDILEVLPFDKVSIPVYTYKNLMFDKNSKGTMVVGYIKSYDAKEETFDVVIYGNYVETIGDFSDAIIFPRVFINEETGEVRSIIGLDVCPASTYSYLYDDAE